MRFAAVLPTIQCYGGVRRYLEIGNELTRRGHDFTLFVDDLKGDAKDCQPSWFNCFFDIYGPNWVSDKNVGKFDVTIMSEHCFHLFIKIPAPIRVYYSIRDDIDENAIAICDVVAANSTRQMIRMKSINQKPVDWIGGINLQQFQPINIKKVSPPQVIFHGKWSAEKGVGYAYHGIELAAKERDLICTPFGDKERVTLRCDCDSSKYFHFPQNKLAKMYSESTITVEVAIDKAGWGNVAIESMACGTPVVCTSVSTEDFAVDGETALVVPIRDAEAVGKAIVKLLDDEKLREKLTTNAMKKIEQFSWENVVNKIEETL